MCVPFHSASETMAACGWYCRIYTSVQIREQPPRFCKGLWLACTSSDIYLFIPMGCVCMFACVCVCVYCMPLLYFYHRSISVGHTMCLCLFRALLYCCEWRGEGLEARASRRMQCFAIMLCSVSQLLLSTKMISAKRQVCTPNSEKNKQNCNIDYCRCGWNSLMNFLWWGAESLGNKWRWYMSEKALSYTRTVL